ncbi:MAG: SusD/RagB family nutrient-binding outer membrane lipoprotein [Cyclobacteriaceae bacterium]
MKNIHKILLSAILTLFMITSCDDGFDEMNTNPIRLTSVDPAFQLNEAIIRNGANYNQLTYQVTICRQMITPFTGVGSGANINDDNRSQTGNVWNTAYQNTIKNLVDGINATMDNPDKSNLYNMLRIMKAYTFMVVSDAYGDVPYFTAGMGFIDGTAFPVYDSQQSIYNDILSELEAASAALSSSGDAVDADVLYGGNIDQWKRFGNSLLLRAAMRLSKVDQSTASSFAAKAVAGGLLQSNDDNALIRHDANYRNAMGTNLNGGQDGFYYLDEEFVNWMQNNNDPRISSIAVRYIGAASNNDQKDMHAAGTGDSSMGAQIGMPQGYDNTSIIPVVAGASLASLYDYSTMDKGRLGNPEAPTFLLTYSQTQLLLAEAIVRGWASGDAEAAYHDGIEGHMQQLSAWPGDTDVAQADIDTYIAAHPLTAGSEIELINDQYWMSSFLIANEVWANFRRSGFPNVSPNPYPGSVLVSEDFIRRLTYPDSEFVVNKANVDAAIGRQGADILDTRVWWDVN